MSEILQDFHDLKPPLPLVQDIKNTVCALCLSAGRRFVRNSKLFYQVRLQIPKFSWLKEEDNICWECHTKMKKMLQFHNQAKNARAVLSNILLCQMGVSIQSLSTLKKHNLETINIIPGRPKNTSEEEIIENKSVSEVPITKKTDPLSFNSEDKNEDKHGQSNNRVNLDDAIKCMIVDRNHTFTSNATAPSEETDKSFLHNLIARQLASTSTKALPSINQTEVIIKMESDQIQTSDDNSCDQNTEIKHNPTDEKHNDSNVSDDLDDSSDTDFLIINQKVKEDSEKIKPTEETKSIPAKADNSDDFNIENEFVYKQISEKEMLDIREMDLKDPVYLNANFRCVRCIFGFKEESSYIAHLDKHNDAYGTEVCSICQLRFRSVEALNSHKKSHFIAYFCPRCEYRSTYMTSLEEHYNAKHRGPSCQICEFNLVFSNEEELAEHMGIFHKSFLRKHTPAECPMCGKKFSSEYRLNTHFRWRHRDDVKHCKKDLSVISSRALRCKPPACQYCGRTFQFTANLKAHIQTVHEKRKVECQACKKKFCSKYVMKAHFDANHGHEKKTHYCKECDKFFKTELRYQIHLKNVKAHAVNRFECDLCGKVFTEKVTLVGHMENVHFGRKRKSCSLCGKSYYNATSLRQHIDAKHSGRRKERNHICNQCGKAFTSKRVMVVHQKTHIGARPYACPHCAYRASQKSTIVRHCKYKHKDQPPVKYQDVKSENSAVEKNSTFQNSTTDQDNSTMELNITP